jgi:Zn-dependent peptidase ImmA (M78 family)/DNA-binding XRE family transcriptional regulator
VLSFEKPPFNPSRLALGRRRRGLTKVQLAEKLGLTYRALVGYEIGEYPPSPEMLDTIAEHLQFPAQFFVGPDLESVSARDVSFRSLSKMTAKHREVALAQSELALYLCKWLEERFELPVVDLPELHREPDPEAAAESLRSYWGVGQLAIRNVVHLLESKGVRVFSLNLETSDVDALSTWKGGMPFVFLNGYKTPERGRFDAAHELGHLILHRHGAPLGRVAEDEAHRFASAFLMPRANVLAHAPRFASVPELIKLKKIFGVSLAAINYRLHELKLISDWHYRSLSIELSKRGFRTSEPEPIERETSLVLPMILGRLYEEGYTRARIAQELGLPLTELESLLFSLVMTGLEGGRTASKENTRRANLRLIK